MFLYDRNLYHESVNPSMHVLKYAWPFYNIIHERVKGYSKIKQTGDNIKGRKQRKDKIMLIYLKLQFAFHYFS